MERRKEGNTELTTSKHTPGLPAPLAPCQLCVQLLENKSHSVHANAVNQRRQRSRTESVCRQTPSWTEVPIFGFCTGKGILRKQENITKLVLGYSQVKIWELGFCEEASWSQISWDYDLRSECQYLLAPENVWVNSWEKRTEFGESTGFGTRETRVCFFPVGPRPFYASDFSRLT